MFAPRIKIIKICASITINILGDDDDDSVTLLLTLNSSARKKSQNCDDGSTSQGEEDKQAMFEKNIFSFSLAMPSQCHFPNSVNLSVDIPTLDENEHRYSSEHQSSASFRKKARTQIILPPKKKIFLWISHKTCNETCNIFFREKRYPHKPNENG